MFRILIAIAVVALAAVVSGGTSGVSAGGGCHSQTLTDGEGVEVGLVNRCYEPNVIRVAAGGTVTWTNEDADAHTVTGVADSFGNYDELAKGDSVSYTFDEAGVFPYFCVLHPSMAGAVVVGDGVPAGGDNAVASIQTGAASSDGGGLSAASVAGIAAVVGLGGAAVGLAGSRVLSRRRVSEAGA